MITKEDLKTSEGLQIYIESLTNAEEALTEEEWREWITKENQEYGTGYDKEDIDFIIDILDEKGLVKNEEKKYIVVDRVRGGDEFDEQFNDKEEALEKARMDWEHLSAYDRKRREAFYVLESINPDVEAEDHFDGDIIMDFMDK